MAASPSAGTSRRPVSVAWSGSMVGASGRRCERVANEDDLMRRLQGTRYVVPLREGGSLPAVVDTSGDGAFVVKFRGAGQGPKALVAEVLAAGLARLFGLPVPEPAIVDLAPDFGKGE